MVIVGFVTLVTSLVGSVTSLYLRPFGCDMRTYSAPMVPGSSGGFPGHNSTTCGLSAPTARTGAHNRAKKDASTANRLIVAPWQMEELNGSVSPIRKITSGEERGCEACHCSPSIQSGRR